MDVIAIPRFERFFRIAAELDVDKGDLKRLSGFVLDEVYNLLIRAQATAKANVRDVIEPSAELAARLALRRGNPARARQQAARAAERRQATFDYRGLARALAVEGAAAERTGDKAAAADLFLRAGRSAAAQGGNSNARVWLRRAISIAAGQPVGRSATDLLRGLDQNDH